MITRLTTPDVSVPSAAPAWSIDDANALYRFDQWSEGFFSINDHGGLVACPEADSEAAIDISKLLYDVQLRGHDLPLLIRFHDILRARVINLNEAFSNAIADFGYRNIYQGVYPIKVNQMREVVEEILDAGAPYGFGLECGSKPELIAALPHVAPGGVPLLCNGYKDHDMLRLMLTGQRLGKAVIPVLEKYREFEQILAVADELDHAPTFGLRLRLAAGGAGKWAASSGDHSKFGVSISELLTMLEVLEARRQTDALTLLHFHLGSQIASIQALRNAVREMTRTYAHLTKRGLSIRYVDVGGGLGVNYGGGYASCDDGINYSLQEYANTIVYAVQEVCRAEGVPEPILVSESGRALTAHHSVLVVQARESYTKDGIDDAYRPGPDEHHVLCELYDALLTARSLIETSKMSTRLEVLHDAVEYRQQAEMLFSYGYLSIEQKAHAERLYWSICQTLFAQIRHLDPAKLPGDLAGLDEVLVDQYLCDFSVFQSMLDHWAIGQRFPIVPLQRLDERPSRRAVLVDLTCDSDGKVDRYIDDAHDKHYLDVHPLREGEPYYLGIFLMGAYQDIMGDLHNLFGRVTEVHVYADADEPSGCYIEKILPGATIRDVLKLVQYSPGDLSRQYDRQIRATVAEGHMRARDGVALLQAYERHFHDPTYLKPPRA
ncbi:MAG: biosynthetic arginine decarboxylase [Rhodothermales bacterium]